MLLVFLPELFFVPLQKKFNLVPRVSEVLIKDSLFAFFTLYYASDEGKRFSLLKKPAAKKKSVVSSLKTRDALFGSQKCALRVSQTKGRLLPKVEKALRALLPW